MKRWLRRLALGVLALVIFVVTAGAGVYGFTTSRLRKTYDIKVAEVRVPTDAAAIEEGRRFATAITKCVDCHGGNLQGKVMIDHPAFGRLIASNLTSGKGGVAANYKSDADWVRSIRHGVRPDGTALMIMPSEMYSDLSDEHLAGIIAYVKSIPPQDNELPPARLGPLARALYTARQMPLFAVETIDHDKRAAQVTPAVSIEYGKYLANVGGCLSCHGANLGGGSAHPGADPNAPLPSNLTPAGPMAKWSEEDFLKALRTGLRPDGSQISTDMPWALTAQMTDDEIRAVWTYLKSVPPVTTVAQK